MSEVENTRRLHVIHLEDNPDDRFLVERAMHEDGFNCEFVHATNEKQFREALDKVAPELVLSDFALPGFDGAIALLIAKSIHPEVPFIFVSGTIGEERAVEALKSGATDYVLKDHLQRLGAVVRRALREAQERSERLRAEAALRHSEQDFRAMFELASIGMAQADVRTGQWLRVNERMCAITGYSSGELLQMRIPDITHPEDRQRVWELFQSVLRGGAAEYRLEKRYLRKDGAVAWVNVNMAVLRDSSGNPTRRMAAIEDITERKTSEQRLRQLSRDLEEMSRQAGIAEIATGVLHNVGNALTSINVASACMAQSLRNSNAGTLSKVVALFREHESDLGQFLASDPKGKLIPGYLTKLSERLIQEQESVLKELTQLQKSVEHIKSIVTIQQNSAKRTGSIEVLKVSDLVEDALGLSGGPFSEAMRVCKEIENDVFITGEKHKLLQILVNLVRNAIQACDEVDNKEKKLSIRARTENERVRITVSDTGVGIPAENLSRIFAHGFTNKKGGHGFGLHRSALIAKEIGGELRAESEGLGRGATFILEIPKSPR